MTEITSTLSSSSSHTITCSRSRPPSGIGKREARSGVRASAWQRQARHRSEPCLTPRRGLESNTLVDRTLPSELQGSGGARHLGWTMNDLKRRSDDDC